MCRICFWQSLSYSSPMRRTVTVIEVPCKESITRNERHERLKSKYPHLHYWFSIPQAFPMSYPTLLSWMIHVLNFRKDLSEIIIRAWRIVLYVSQNKVREIKIYTISSMTVCRIHRRQASEYIIWKVEHMKRTMKESRHWNRNLNPKGLPNSLGKYFAGKFSLFARFNLFQPLSFNITSVSHKHVFSITDRGRRTINWK